MVVVVEVEVVAVLRMHVCRCTVYTDTGPLTHAPLCNLPAHDMIAGGDPQDAGGAVSQSVSQSLI